MTGTTAASAIFWTGTLLGVMLAGAMVWRRAWRELPLFFSYTVFITVRSAVLYLVRPGNPWTYFYGYWGTEVISWIWCLAAIQEIMTRLCAPYASIQRLIVVLFRWGGALLIALAVFTAYASPGSDPERMMAGILIFERSVRIVQVGLLSLLFVFARFLRLRWPHYAFGIALGFAVFCSVELAAITVRAHGGMAVQTTFAYLKAVAFLVAQAIWVLFIAVPEHSGAPERFPAVAMEGWDTALADLLRR